MSENSGSYRNFHSRAASQLEHYRSSTTITDATDVKDYQTAADSVRKAALSADLTRSLIAEIADEMERLK
ncbi:Scr1 family TA system antitoxin-like transcriptional regulator [Saccharopolyspora sp. ASAGF58]|uniref:Scr1 family TA system antitoxin-like transcriptional regulator n=1 Tax=Saccharopolyspora sp. ASAGF58 TaxID=2719023 RepID=UPI001FF0A3ED|nr:Scr1 family TA system antitoxin-like transcriptional regulator [Saccharopolyspora sp. ASAGF58]